MYRPAECNIFSFWYTLYTLLLLIHETATVRAGAHRRPPARTFDRPGPGRTMEVGPLLPPPPGQLT